MLSTKKDVDRHVRISLSKLRTENEKNSRGYVIAKLYYNIKDYENAEHYVSNYLSVKGDAAPAHKLLGKCYLNLNKPDKALSAFQRSLQIEPKQQDLLADVCKLLLNNETSLNINTAKYWCDLAEMEKVQDDAVFNLKLKLLNSENMETKQVEDLIMKEIMSKPNDPNLRVRLVKYFLEEGKIIDAFKYIYDLEIKHSNLFACSLDWYNIIWFVLMKYKESDDYEKNWNYWYLIIVCLERQMFLKLCETTKKEYTQIFSLSDISNTLFEFDQYLFMATNSLRQVCPEKELVTIFINHYRGQFCLHAATYLFNQEIVQNKNRWRETTKIAFPLLLFAYHCSIPDIQESRLKHSGELTKQLLPVLNRQGAFRCIQAGRTLLSCIDESKIPSLSSQVQNLISERDGWINADTMISQIRRTCSSNDWRSNLFKILFTTPNHLNKMQTSNLIKSSQLAEPNYELPRYNEIESYEEIAQYLRPQSLPHMVYMCIGRFRLTYFHCKYFNGLNFSCQNLSSNSAESLSQLDMDTFLYGATIQAKRILEVENIQFEDLNKRNYWKPLILPYASILSKLCTEEQSNWWMSAYRVYKSLAMDNLAELRATLQHGIEAVRCVSGPKIDLIIILKLAQIFSDRAKNCERKPNEKAALEARVEKLFKYGLHMIKLHQKNVLEPFRKLFKYVVGHQNSVVERDINILGEEAVTYLSSKYFNNGQYEELIEEFSGLQLPFATYYQAEAYLKLDQLNKTPKSSKQIYGEKAKEYLNQTLNLLELSNIESDHPLKSVVPNQIKRLQQSDKFSFSSNYSNGCETDELYNDSFSFLQNRQSLTQSDIRIVATPKIDELENLVRQMNRTLCFLKEELIDVIKPDVSGIKGELVELKEKLLSIEDNMKKRSDAASTDDAANVLEELCIMDELQNQHSLYQNFNPMQQRMNTPNTLLASQPHQQPAPLNSYNNPLYNTNYPVNYYAQYGLPPAPPNLAVLQPPPGQQKSSVNLAPHMSFVDNMHFGLSSLPQQLHPPHQPPPQTQMGDSRTNFLNLLTQSANNQPTPILGEKAVSTPQSSSLQQFWSRTFNNAPVEKAPPVNVVITSSDPLPTLTSISQAQPTLSVTIPAQHIKQSITANISPFINQIQTQPIAASNQPFPQSLTNPSFPIPLYNLPVDNTSISVTPSTISTITTSTPNSNQNLSMKLGDPLIKTFGGESEIKPICGLLNDKLKVEKILFTGRAKMLIFVEKDFKELGMRELKMIKYQSESLTRLFICDNAHKNCTSQNIDIDFELKPTSLDEKMVTYTVKEVVDGKSRLEKYCLCFKHVPVAKAFCNAVKSLQNLMRPLETAKINEVKPESEKKIESSGSGGGFSMSGFSFKQNVNPPTTQTMKTSFGVSQTDNSTKPSLFDSFTFAASGSSNTIDGGAVKPFANIFANLNKTPTETALASSNLNKSFQDNNETSKKEILNKPEDDDYVPTAEFKPVIALPELVQLQTGEENEKILFEHRAKLLRYDGTTAEWKERGIGNIKLLADVNNANSVRLLMRREIVLKVCCNQRLTKNTKFNKLPNSNTALSWAGRDFAEEEIQDVVLAIRFKTADICQNFYDAILKAQANMTDESEDLNDVEKPSCKSNEKPSEGFGDKFKPAIGSWECTACYVVNKSGVTTCCSCGSSKEKDNNGKVATPAINFLEQKTESDLKSYKVEGFGDKFKPKAGSWCCKSCYVSNESAALYCVACNSPKDDTIPKKTGGALDLSNTNSNFSFGFNSDTTKQSSGFNFNSKPTVGFQFGFNCFAPNSENSLNENTTISNENTTSLTEANLTPSSLSSANTLSSLQSNTPIFGVPITTSGSNISTTSTVSKTGFAFDTSSIKSVDNVTNEFSLEKPSFNFVLKMKQPTKIKSPQKNASGVDDESGGEEDEEENTAYFTPVIPLPDKIDVKTGEEEEEVLYCHRAKLYRFTESEWKERGLGDVKILRHKESKKLRVVMRREQILKICLNHILSEVVDYKQKDDKSWHFIVNDFSEGEIELMQFCLRFKTSEIADQFIKAIRDALDNKLEAIDSSEKDSSQNINYDIECVEISENDRILADKFQLPYSFFSEKLHDKCDGCRGCDPDNFIFPKIVASDANTDAEDINSPLSLVMPILSPKKITNSILKKSVLASENIEIKAFGQNETKPFSPFFGKSNDNVAQKDSTHISTDPKPFVFNKDNDANKFLSGGNIFGNSKLSGGIIGFGSSSQSGDKANLIFGGSGDSVPPKSIFGTSTDSGTSKSIFSGSGELQKTIFGGNSTFGSGKLETQTPLFGTGTFDVKNIFGGSKVDGQSDKSGNSTLLFGAKTDLQNPIFASKDGNQTPLFAKAIDTPTSIFSGKEITKAPIFGNKANVDLSKSDTTGNSETNTETLYFGANNFGVKSSKDSGIFTGSLKTPAFGLSLNNTGNTIFGTVKPPGVDQTNANILPVVTESNSTEKDKENNDVNEKQSNANDLFFKNDTGLSFSSLAQTANSKPAFSDAENTKGFIGLTGNDAFKNFLGTKDASNKTQNEYSSPNVSGTEEPTYDPHYEPIIALPEEIVVTTGEENEEKLLGERATLYRYDNVNKEWKERGVGELKILHHPGKGTYRLVMRREQIHKLVLNHSILPEFQMKMMSNNSTKSYCWGAMNYAEEKGELEQLAARFKTPEIGLRFATEVNKCISQLKKCAETEKVNQ